MISKSESQKITSCSRRRFLQRSVLSGAAAYGALSLARNVHAAGSDVIKVGLIGCGGRGSGAAVNAMNAGKDVRLVAMADVFAERIENSLPLLKKQKPEQVAVDDAHRFVGFDAYEKLIHSDVDVVLIAATSHFHPVFLKAAVDAGKHVFCEKPAAIDVPGLKMARAAAEEAKKKNLSLVSGLVLALRLGRPRGRSSASKTARSARSSPSKRRISAGPTCFASAGPIGTKCSTSSRTGTISIGSRATTPRNR